MAKERKGTSLKLWLKNTDAYTVKIGCQDGSSFMYCGSTRIDIVMRMFANIVELVNEYEEHVKPDNTDWSKQTITDVQRDINARIMELAKVREALDRPVVNSYPSIDVPNQMIVEVEGYWNCRYWDIQEFDERWK